MSINRPLCTGFDFHWLICCVINNVIRTCEFVLIIRFLLIIMLLLLLIGGEMVSVTITIIIIIIIMVSRLLLFRCSVLVMMMRQAFNTVYESFTIIFLWLLLMLTRIIIDYQFSINLV